MTNKVMLVIDLDMDQILKNERKRLAAKIREENIKYPKVAGTFGISNNTLQDIARHFATIVEQDV